MIFAVIPGKRRREGDLRETRAGGAPQTLAYLRRLAVRPRLVKPERGCFKGPGAVCPVFLNEMSKVKENHGKQFCGSNVFEISKRMVF